jgi:type I restriction enzyme S subunit
MTDFNVGNFFIDKSNWTKAKFGDVAYEPKESVKDAVAEGIEHVVGLEHIDSEDVHLRRSASIEEGTTFTKRFRKGDVLFGRRRAYLKKAARAEFEGICSGDIIVLRAHSEVLIPGLMPFLVNNDKFFDYAVTHSAGGLSPRVKFKDLVNQELLIPPVVEQPKVLHLLSSLIDLSESCKKVIKNQNDLLKSYRMEVFGRANWQQRRLKDFFEVQLGKMLSAKAKEGDAPCLYLANQNVQWGRVDLSKLNRMDFTEKEKEKFSLKDGDLLVCEGGEVGRAAIWRNQAEECYYQKALHRLRVKNESFLPEIMLEYMFWANERGMFKRLTGHSTIAHLTAVKLKEMDVPEIPLCHQYDFLDRFQSIHETRRMAEVKLKTSNQLVKTFLGRVF